jgi:glycosyltransferase involved in cell wall biosynthesis
MTLVENPECHGRTARPKPKILLMTMQPPRMPGMGGEVRTYYFIKTATELGDVTLVSLGGPGGSLKVQQDIAERCRLVIEPGVCRSAGSVPHRTSSRLASWMRTLAVFIAPWRNQWSNFLTYCLQYCPPNQNVCYADARWTKRLLASVLRAEFNLISRFVNVPPLTAFLFSESYAAIRPTVHALLQHETFDLIWIENTITYPFAREIIKFLRNPRLPILCNAQNIETLVQQRIASNASTTEEQRYFQRQTDLMRAMETEAYRNSDLVIQCSEQDAEIGRRMVPETDFCVIGNGVNIDYFQPRSDSTRHHLPTVVFTAGFGYGPNREGLEYFVRKVFPLIRRDCPDCRFVFAGADASEMMEQLAINDESIECHSNPKDIRPYFEQAWVYVVPLLAGGGTRLKILEAMSMQRAIVSTSLGAEGIPCTDGVHLALADEPEQFAREVVALLKDPVRRGNLERSAAAWVRANYSWDILTELARTRLATFLEKMAGQPESGPVSGTLAP